jgi:hypothetical protein
MVLFPVNAHHVVMFTPISLQSCGWRTVIAAPLCLHYDRFCVRQSMVQNVSNLFQSHSSSNFSILCEKIIQLVVSGYIKMV